MMHWLPKFITHHSAFIIQPLAERVGFEPTVRFPVHSISSAASSATPAPLQFRKQEAGSRVMLLLPGYCLLPPCHLAERVGFEPTVPLRVQRFSRPPDSATLAPLRIRGPALSAKERLYHLAAFGLKNAAFGLDAVIQKIGRADPDG